MRKVFFVSVVKKVKFTGFSKEKNNINFVIALDFVAIFKSFSTNNTLVLLKEKKTPVHVHWLCQIILKFLNV